MSAMLLDAVILAAGASARLAGIVPPYFKPLMVVGGRSLIGAAFETTRAAVSGTVVIVVAPENCAPLVGLLRSSKGWAEQTCRIVVQPRPTGPAVALSLGTEMTTSTDVLVVCADNVTSLDDMNAVASAPTQSDRPVVGTHFLDDASIASRFTLFTEDGGAAEKPCDVGPFRWADGRFRAWIGPVRLNRWVISNLRGEFIGPHLSGAHLVPIDSYDIGIPEVAP